MPRYRPVSVRCSYLRQFNLASVALASAIALLPVATLPALPRTALAQTRPMPSHTLTDGAWQLQEARYSNGETVAIDTPSRYTMEFSNDGRVSLRADCNVGTGRYARSDNRLTLQLGGLTRVACPPGSWSDRYLRDLAQVTRYSLAGDRLILHLGIDAGELVFAPLPATAELAGSSWRFAEAIYPGHRLLITASDRYTLTFGDSRNVAVLADCNRSSGTYTQNGSELAIALGPTTLAACPPPSLFDQYLRDLGSVARYSLEGDRLRLELRDGLGTLLFDAVD